MTKREKAAIVILGAILVAMVAMLLRGVPASARAEQRARADAERRVTPVGYFRDERTGLCFAWFWRGTGNGGPGLASVSCSPEVIKLLGEAP